MIRRVLVVGASLLFACSDDPSVTPAPARADAGQLGGDAGPDAASITPRPDLCEKLTRGGDVVQEIELGGEPTPPVGGTVVPGTYDLIELDAYRGSAPIDAGTTDPGEPPPSTRLTGRAAQITIVVGEFSMSTIAGRGTSQPGGLGPEQINAVLYRTEGASLIETAVCPTTALPAGRPYSAVSESVILFPDATHRELYRRRP